MTGLRVDRWVRHPPAQVWAAVVTPAVAARWLPFDGFRAEIGHRFVARGPEGPVPCELVDLEEPRHLVIAWNDPGRASTVELTLSPESGGTRILLFHREVSPSRRAPLEGMWSAVVRARELDPPRGQARWLLALGGLGAAAVVLAVAWTTASEPPPDPVAPAPPEPVVVDAPPPEPAPAAGPRSFRPPFRVGEAEVLQVFESPRQGYLANPVWSFDGRFLAFETADASDGALDLWVGPVTQAGLGTPSRVLLPGRPAIQEVFHPTWMREGYVLFQGVSAGGASRIYYQAGGGSRASELVRWSDLGGDLSQPSDSPDGRGVVFVGTEQADLLVRHTETANIRNLTNTAGHEVAPRISRAGDTVYFQRQSVQGWDVWSVPFAGGVETLVAGGPGDQLRPNPAADGWVVWFDVQGDACTVVAGRGAERRVLAADVRLPLRAPPALDPDGRFVAVARDHELDILVVPVEGEWQTEVPLPGRRCGEPALAWRSDQFLLAAVCGRELALVALETAP